MESEKHDNDPCTYQTTMNDKDIESWKWAMESEIWQMDVKTAFLNGHIQEDIFMDQPEGFISYGHQKCAS